MKIALIHDSFTHIGGAEKVLLELIKIYPQADIYIPILATRFKKDLSKLSGGKIHTTFFSKFANQERCLSYIKPFLLLYWRQLDLRSYGLVISSSHSFNSKLVKTPGKTKHISYIHTPPKYLYDEFNEKHIIKKWPFSLLFYPLKKFLAFFDKKLTIGNNINLIIANSQITKKRIKKYYQLESMVIYPPAIYKNNLIASKRIKTKKNKPYLFFSRLVKQKGPELAIKTFNKLNKKLIVIGTGPEENNLKKLAKQNIEFKGFVPKSKLSYYLSQAKALIYCSIDEDFGIVPVEAMAHGLPIIGYNSGGLRETVINGKTGVLFNDYSVSGLSKAIKKFEQTSIKTKDCSQQAQNFSAEQFKTELSNQTQRLMKSNNHE